MKLGGGKDPLTSPSRAVWNLAFDRLGIQGIQRLDACLFFLGHYARLREHRFSNSHGVTHTLSRNLTGALDFV